MRKIRMKKLAAITGILLMFCAVAAFGQVRIGIDGAVEWDKMEINAVVSLDLASAGLKLPSGRTQGEAIMTSEYLRLIRPGLFNIQVDSSSTIKDLVLREEWSLQEVESLALQATTVPAAHSQDLRLLSSSYTLGIDGISAAFIRHSRPTQLQRTLSPVAAPSYTGIIILAAESLPVHGRNVAALPLPCLFPKVWDNDMNLIFEKNMLNPGTNAMVRYFHVRDIFSGGPSGLSPEIAAVVGSHPLRIVAQGVFGIFPTDPIISREDALLIISNDENRRLFNEGRVVIILNESVLKEPLE